MMRRAIRRTGRKPGNYPLKASKKRGIIIMQKYVGGGVLTAFFLKLLACIAMLVDHSAFVFESQLTAVSPWLYLGCRVFGRLAFPLFAFGIAEGAAHTSSPKKYITRMIVFALIAQIPYSLMLGTKYASATFTLLGHTVPVYYSLSVMFTLLLGLIACLGLEANKPFWTAFAIGVAYILDRSVGIDYGFLGVMLIIALYLARNSKPGLVIVMLLYSVCFYIVPVRDAIAQLSAESSTFSLTSGLMKWAAMASVSILLLLYSGEEGKKAKLFIYSFYPLHMLILWLFWMIDRLV